VIVDNRPGAALTIGTGIAAKAAPDGHTLVMSDRTAIAAAPSLFANLPYDPVKDLAPISLVAKTPQILIAHPSVVATTLQDFVAYARSQPQGFSHATAGPGTANHLAGELMRQATGVNLVPIHYKGAWAATMSVVTGEVKASFSLLPIALPLVKAGKIKAVAITGRTRFASAPEVPTVSEAGYSELESEYWVGLLAPARTPLARVDHINAGVAEVLNTSATRALLINQGALPAAGTPKDFASFIDAETLKWSKVIRTAGIRLE
jgi:tripartite-type tricarboxylate transporter receptor subunit TctC